MEVGRYVSVGGTEDDSYRDIDNGLCKEHVSRILQEAELS